MPGLSLPARQAARVMPRLTLNLLGAPEILLDGRPVKGLYAQVAALLAYLAVETGRAHSRDALVELLWPNESPELGRQNLRQAISRLRNAIGDRDNPIPFIQTEHGAVELNRAAEVWCDAQAFEAACRDSRLDISPVLTAQGIQWLSHAVQLYRGELLAGFAVPDSAVYEEWLATQRERFHRLAIAALERGCAHYQQAGQRDAALAMARRLVDVEPAEEKGHRLLMTLLADADQPLAALAQYRACEHYLRENLGVTPGAETRALFERLSRRIEGADAPSPQRRERRRVTLLQAGLSGGPRDPEDLLRWRDLLQEQAAEQAARLDAVVRTPDDMDVVLCFGYPRAAADDAQRAAKAALALQAWAKRALPDGTALSLGLAGGLMVLMEGDGPHLVGSAALGAARLRHLAPAGEVLVGEETWQLLRQDFHGRRAPELERPDSGTLYLLRGPSRDPRRVASAPPLIGRERDLDAVLACWERARAGAGNVLVVSGVPGIGKSHLLRSVREGLATGAAAMLSMRCLPANSATALEPFLRLLREYCGLSADEPVARQLHKFGVAARRLGFDDAERQLLAAMLDIAADGAAAPLSPSARQRTMGLLLRLVRAAAAEPLLFCIEDVHWMDPSSTELVRQMVEEIDHLPMLLLITTQTDLGLPWLAGPRVSELRLAPLDEARSRALVEAVADGALCPEMVAHIVRQCGGVPLFLRELAKAVVENPPDAGGLAGLAQVPASLQDSLLARLDRLQEAGRIARLAAVIGREFDLASLETLSQTPARALSPLLARLIEAHIVEPADDRGGNFAFCHGLIHELAYQTLLRTERRELHARLAVALEARAAGEPIAPETLARHFQAAELPEQAVRFYYLGGIKAFGRFAFRECIAHLRQALDLLPVLPDPTRRDPLELRLRVALGFPMLLLDSTHREARENFDRAEALLETVDDPRLLTAALRSLCSYHISRAAFERSEPLLQRFLVLAGGDEDPLTAADAHVMYGLVLALQGKTRQAQPLIERGVALADATSPAHAVRYGSDPGAIGLASLAFCLVVRGRPDQALAYADQALSRSRALDHPLSFVWTSNMALSVLQLSGEDERALALSEEVLALCRARRIDSWAHWATMLRHRVLAGRSGDHRHLEQMLESRERMLGNDSEAIQPYPDILTVECCLELGEIDQGLALIERLEHHFTRTGAMLFYPELLRLRALMMIARDPDGAAAAAAPLKAAFNLATRQRSALFQLRAALALAELPEAGRRAEGERLLRRTLAGFRRGVTCADLRRARERLGVTQAAV